MSTLPPAIFIMGPTASGKTDLALRLVETLPCEIISVDSVMIYRGMDIGTAKPDADILHRAPHRLINICDPAETYSAARFRDDALAEMKDIQLKGKIPLLVGGTFLYFRALEKGLSPLPSADPEIRKQIEQQAQDLGWDAMHAKLKDVDPVAAERIHSNDAQRIQRALEVYELTGQSMTEFFDGTDPVDFPFRVSKLILSPGDRTDLHQRIETRFHQMLELGFVSEVEALYQREDLHSDLPSMRAVGYRQVWEHLEGKLDSKEMVERGIIATRQYAKRQMTWLRSEQNGHWLDSMSDQLFDDALKVLESDAISI